MRTVVIYGKRFGQERPQDRYPGATFWGMGRGCSEHWNGRLHWDAWFELHPIDPTRFHRGIIATRPRTWDWLCRQPAVGQPGHRPVYLLKADARCPASVPFPFADLEAQFPPAPGEPNRWDTCMMDSILPFAFLQGFDRAVIVGHGIARQASHMLAHVGILYWIGYLRGRGMRIDVEAPSWYRAPAGRYGRDTGTFEPALPGDYRKLRK